MYNQSTMKLMLFASLFSVMSTNCRSQSISCIRIVDSSSARPTELAAVELLAHEGGERTRFQWHVTRGRPAHGALSGLTIFLAVNKQIKAMLPSYVRKVWLKRLPSAAEQRRAEGFTIATVRRHSAITLIVAGNDSRGVLYGAGYVLRKLELKPGTATLSGDINATLAPQYPIRSHQIGYRFKNNTYDAWTLPMFEQQIRDLAVFGASGLQLIAPKSDDAPTSPLFPAPPLQTLVGISRALAKYGLNCDLYYPELRHDYSNTVDVHAELRDFEELVKALPYVDGLFVPGGDPGHTEPKYLFPLVAKEAAILRRYHPAAQVWISAQGFSREWYEEFYSQLNPDPAWLTGVFFGPQSRDSFEIQRARVPSRYRMIFYPDIGHTMHAQFPVPQWDPVYAMVEGREPINPRPVDETHIYRHFANLHTGFVTYSEGVNDDVNKFVWTQLGWSRDADPHETLRDYARYFLGSQIGNTSSDIFADALFDLEKDWLGSLAQNKGVNDTLHLFQRLERDASSEQRRNWRFESALYRAYYDAYLRVRLTASDEQEHQALEILEHARSSGSEETMSAAELVLAAPGSPEELELRSRVFDLAKRLFQHVGLQLSVTLYGASAVERGANLDRIDVPLDDRVWIENEFAKIRRMPTEQDRVKALEAITHWQTAVPGTLYDDLGDPQHEPHLVRGDGFDADPELYHTAIDGIADHTTNDGWRMSWLDYAETLYEFPLKLRYEDLDPTKQYRLRITYAGENYALPLTLTGNGTIIHAARLRRSNPEIVEFELSSEVTKSGHLELEWQRPDGLGGSGRGRQIAEVWLIPE